MKVGSSEPANWRQEAATLETLTIANRAVYELMPPVPGIGQ